MKNKKATFTGTLSFKFNVQGETGKDMTLWTRLMSLVLLMAFAALIVYLVPEGAWPVIAGLIKRLEAA